MNLIETRAREREGSRKILENRAQEREKQIAPLFSVTEINQNIFITIDIPQFSSLHMSPSFFLLCVFVVLSRPGWGICTLFKTSLWGFGMNPPAPPWGRRAVSNAPSQPPGTTLCTAFAFNACECTVVHSCGERSFSPLHIS